MSNLKSAVIVAVLTVLLVYGSALPSSYYSYYGGYPTSTYTAYPTSYYTWYPTSTYGGYPPSYYGSSPYFNNYG